MSLHSYEQSKSITADIGHGPERDVAFSALIMAAARKADSENFAKLEAAFPEIVGELRERYNAPGGLLPHEVRAVTGKVTP